MLCCIGCCEIRLSLGRFFPDIQCCKIVLNSGKILLHIDCCDECLLVVDSVCCC